MIDTGEWGPLNRKVDFSPLPIEDKDDLILLGVSDMTRNTEELRTALARGDGRLFALLDDGEPVSGFLDVNQAVVIAATYGQEVLALDYSRGDVPRVVSTRYESGVVRWVEVAPSFDDLAKLLKL
jgi:hypothetical protein